jgi:hypothetical protein
MKRKLIITESQYKRLINETQIVVEEISFQELKKYLLISEGKATVLVDKIKEENVIGSINSYYSNNSNIFGNFTFNLETTTHWLQRLDRTKEPEFINNINIFDPDDTEGIDLVFKSLPNISEKIKNYDWNKSNSICLKLKTKSYNNNGDLVPYTEVIRILKDNKPKNYTIRLITHMKGIPLFDKNYDNCSTTVIT